MQFSKGFFINNCLNYSATHSLSNDCVVSNVFTFYLRNSLIIIILTLCLASIYLLENSFFFKVKKYFQIAIQ